MLALFWGLVWMNFSATPDFLPLPYLSCKAHRGKSIGKMSLEAQQKAHGSYPIRTSSCLSGTDLQPPYTCSVCHSDPCLSQEEHLASTSCCPSLPSLTVPREELCPPPARVWEPAQCVILRLQVINYGCLW